MRKFLMLGLVVAALAGCRPSAPTPSANEGSEGSAPEANSAGSGEGSATSAEFDAPTGVEFALTRAQAAVAERLLEMARPTTPGDDEGTGSGRQVRLLFASNVNGELIDCGCPHHPLGGLARRATIADLERANDGAPLAFFHADAGNTLFQNPAPLDDSTRTNATIRAQAIADGLHLAGVPALVPGMNDLSGGIAALEAVARGAELPLLTCNLREGERQVGESWLAVEDGGVRVAYVGVTGADAAGQTSGATVERAAPLAAAALSAARATAPALVVLIHTGGVGEARRLLDEIEPFEVKPDVIIVSGSGRMMRDAQWYRGVAIAEADIRGKNLLAIDITLVDGASGFGSPTPPGTDSISAYLTALRASERTLENTMHRGPVDPGVEERREDAYARMRNRQLVQLAAAESRFAEVDPGALHEVDAGPRSLLATRLIPVEIAIEERADVKRIVDRALERMGVTR